MRNRDFRNITDEDLEVPMLGRTVEADAVVEVPGHLVPYFLAGTATWELIGPEPDTDPPPAKKPAKRSKE